jgi:hypothetical protein
MTVLRRCLTLQVYDHVLSEADLGKIYTAQYRSSAVSTNVAMVHSHALAGNAYDVQASKKVYKGASKKGLSKIPDLVGFWPLSGDANVRPARFVLCKFVAG